MEWWLRPIYSLPWLLCTGPLSLLLLLIFVARTRNRGYVGDEEEPVVTLPQPEFLPEPENAFVTATFVDAASAETSPDEEARWDSQWGDVDWGFGGSGERTPAPSPAANGTSGAASDPWKSG